MRNLEKFSGVIPAFYACYDENGAVSKDRAKKLTRYYIEKGVQGVYVGGSSGECIYQTVPERKAILEAVMEEAKGKITVIAHIACNNTNESCELAAHAESLGVDAIAAIPPIYFKLPEYAIAEYWNDISAAAPNTDFIIYNIPQLAGVALTMPLLSKMLENPRVIGVKNSSMPTMDIQRFLNAGGKDFVVFNGPDEQFISGRIIGAAGGIGGTYGAMVELFLEMNRCLKTGELERAAKIQNDVNEIIYAMCSCHGNMYAVIKEILRRRDGLDIGGVRKPLCNIIKEDDAQIERCMSMLKKAYEAYL